MCSIGDIYCYDCFDKRKSSANRTYEDKNILLHGFTYSNILPVLGVCLFTGDKYPDFRRFHLYFSNCHEKWIIYHKRGSHLQKCSKCSDYVSDYYKLDSKE